MSENNETIKEYIPEHEVVKGPTNWVASTTDADRLKHTGVAKLVQDDQRLEVVGGLLHIGLEAANEEGVG
jgi:hypothetical protein